MFTDNVVGTQQGMSISRTRVGWMRIGAGVLDFIILSCLQIWISSIFGIINPSGDEHLIDWDGFSFSLSGLATLNSLWLFVIVFLYFFLQEALVGTTPGKLFFGLYVARPDGGRVTVTAALVRNVMRFVDSLPMLYMVGLVSCLFSPTFQRLGDRMAHTTVVPIKAARASVQMQRIILRRYAFLCLGILVLVGVCLNYVYYHRPPLIVQSWANTNNSYSFHSANTVPACGKVTQNSGDLVLNRHIQLLNIRTPEWHNDTVVYPIEYADQVRCSATVTLHWHGFLKGWSVANVELNS